MTTTIFKTGDRVRVTVDLPSTKQGADPLPAGTLATVVETEPLLKMILGPTVLSLRIDGGYDPDLALVTVDDVEHTGERHE